MVLIKKDVKKELPEQLFEKISLILAFELYSDTFRDGEVFLN